MIANSKRAKQLAGGGALQRDLDRLLAEETALPVLVAEAPLTCVVRGSRIAIEPMDKLCSVFSYEYAWWRAAATSCPCRTPCTIGAFADRRSLTASKHGPR
ncbi:hypothetical protein BG61_07885 [Caballeronia glathei]|uniref:Uncharacterized protein n=1 Tax=Caballeronia glathei TaxID=60547 RepID=A0A069PD76_9BURK|nr:hypothetical protein BG61_07885 [Caballeronia glathei]